MAVSDTGLLSPAHLDAIPSNTITTHLSPDTDTHLLRSRPQTQHTQNASGCIQSAFLFFSYTYSLSTSQGKENACGAKAYQQIRLSGLERWLCERELALLPENPSLGSSTHARRLTATCNSHSMPPDTLFGLQEHLHTCTYPLTHTDTHTLKFLKN